MTDDADDLPEWDGDGLGPLVSEHPAGSGRHRAILAVAGVLGAAGLAVGTFMGFGAAFMVWVALMAGSPCALLVAAAGAGMSVFMTVSPITLFVQEARRMAWRVLLYEGGFVLVTRDRAEVVRWGNVAAVFRCPTATRLWAADGITVRTQSGRSVDLTAMYHDGGALAAAVRAGVLAAQVPVALDTLAAGGRVPFTLPRLGRLFSLPQGLVVSAAGLDDGRGVVPWAAVTGVAVVPARLVRDRYRVPHLFVWTAGRRPWFRCPATAFPNVDLFLTLVTQCRTGRAPGPGCPRPRPGDTVRGGHAAGTPEGRA